MKLSISKYTLAALIVVMAVACNSSKNTPASAVGLVPLNNYFVKNTVPGLNDSAYTYKVFVSQNEFDQFAGVAATMTNSIQKPDFNGQIVVAVAGRPSTTWQDISFERAAIGGKTLHVYFKAVQGETKSFSSASLALAAVPKSKDVTKVKFYNNEVLSGQVAVKIP